jgi:hypothetical protein
MQGKVAYLISVKTTQTALYSLTDIIYQYQSLMLISYHFW